MLSLLLLAVGVGASNLAASIGIGMSGVDGRTRLRVGLVFGFFEAVMPLVGLAIGHSVASGLGSVADDLGGALLMVVGCYTLVVAVRAGEEHVATADNLGRLSLTGLALSIDNLVVGFALGTVHVSFVVAVVVIAAVSVAMSLLGLEFGRHLGARVERGSEVFGGVVLVVVGIAVAAGVLG